LWWIVAIAPNPPYRLIRRTAVPDTTWREILKETKNYEKQAMMGILKKIAEECKGSIFFKDNETVKIKGVNYNIRHLKYVVKKTEQK